MTNTNPIKKSFNKLLTIPKIGLTIQRKAPTLEKVSSVPITRDQNLCVDERSSFQNAPVTLIPIETAPETAVTPLPTPTPTHNTIIETPVFIEETPKKQENAAISAPEMVSFQGENSLYSSYKELHDGNTDTMMEGLDIDGADLDDMVPESDEEI